MEPSAPHPEVESAWHAHRGYLVGMATRVLGDRSTAEDVVQEAFGRLTTVELADVRDVRGWLAVVVRRLCLDHLKSSHVRRETATDELGLEARSSAPTKPDDPFERISLDSEIQLALAIVLDQLSPAERTAFLLHDIFAFPFTAIAGMVGRTPAACRQLASRARRSIEAGGLPARPQIEVDEQRIVTERFIAACAGGDLADLMAVLDPDVDGVATLIGVGPVGRTRGPEVVATRLIELFGPATDRVLVPVPIEDSVGVAVLTGSWVGAVLKLEIADGRVHHLEASYRLPPRGS